MLALPGLKEGENSVNVYQYVQFFGAINLLDAKEERNGIKPRKCRRCARSRKVKQAYILADFCSLF
jgi:hypothetical protein